MLTIILILSFIYFLSYLSYRLGNKKHLEIIKHQEQLTKYEQLETELLEKQLSHNEQLLQQANELISKEDYYKNGLQQEIDRIENELANREQQNIPTREQLETWLFMLQAENRLNSKQANQIKKLYDSRNMFPKNDTNKY